MKRHFLAESRSRGFWHQCSNEQNLGEMTHQKIVVGYIGFDATAKSLQIGNLVAIMWLRLLQRCGHKPIVIMGGGTTMIGDPSGKDEGRKILDQESIQHNIARFEQTFRRYLTFGDGPTDALILNNADWLQDIKYIDFLRDIGRHFTINRMLTFDSVQLRLSRQQPLSFLEFNYMLLQAYDFHILHERYGCTLQMGGSDQWGNIINGIDLVRRLCGKEVFGLTAPLIVKSDGTKMGKSSAGSVWLSADCLDPYDYWQFWRNTTDEDTIRFLKLFTDLPLDEIDKLSKLQGSDINDAKKILADEATRLAHGDNILPSIHQGVAKAFGGDEEGGCTSDSSLTQTLVGPWPYSLDQLLVETGFCQTKGEARRLVQGKGVRIDDVVVEDFKTILSKQMDKAYKVSVGKKRHLWIM